MKNKENHQYYVNPPIISIFKIELELYLLCSVQAVRSTKGAITVLSTKSLNNDTNSEVVTTNIKIILDTIILLMLNIILS